MYPLTIIFGSKMTKTHLESIGEYSKHTNECWDTAGHWDFRMNSHIKSSLVIITDVTEVILRAPTYRGCNPQHKFYMCGWSFTVIYSQQLRTEHVYIIVLCAK